jgi:hypothetical protein
MQRFVVSTAMIIGLSAPVLGASQFDGDWSGQMVATRDSYFYCGFERRTFKAKVKGGRVFAVGKDLSHERTFVDTIEGDGSVDVWGSWRVVLKESESSTAPAQFKGKFDADTFHGSLFAQKRIGGGGFGNEGTSICQTRIFLRREASVATTATALVAAAANGEVETVVQMVRSGADINAADGAGNTPLTAAVAGGHAAIVDLLINAGAAPDRVGGNNLTPLEQAERIADPQIITILESASRRRTPAGVTPRVTQKGS